VDRASLELLLRQGLSLAEIGRRIGRHESTVGYWAQKHGLEAVNRDKHVAKGPLEREQLGPLVEAGMSIAEIGESVGRSKATVRHWLTRYGLKTHGAFGRRLSPQRAVAREAGVQTLILPCRHHGETDFVLDKRGQYRCKQCRSKAVARRRRRVKRLLVDEAGGPAQCADTPAMCEPCTSTTSSRRASVTKSTLGARRWLSIACVLRRESASYSAPTAMQRSRQV
jgi:transposase